jgi:hypothetical protein
MPYRLLSELACSSTTRWLGVVCLTECTRYRLLEWPAWSSLPRGRLALTDSRPASVSAPPRIAPTERLFEAPYNQQRRHLQCLEAEHFDCLQDRCTKKPSGNSAKPIRHAGPDSHILKLKRVHLY